MFQCLGLGTADEGGCGEDWWHPECVIGIPRDWFKKSGSNNSSDKAKGVPTESKDENNSAADQIKKDGDTNTATQLADAVENAEDQPDEDDPPLPPGFPNEDDFEHFICYQCVEAFPWIKRYVNSAGFLSPVHHKMSTSSKEDTKPSTVETATTSSDTLAPPKKRKAEDDADDDAASQTSKRYKPDGESTTPAGSTTTKPCSYTTLPPAPGGVFSIFVTENFRDSLCRCAACFPKLQPHRPLLEEEEAYEPPLSSDSGAHSAQHSHVISGGHSAGTGSIYDRGEAALSNVDRVRAIEGVMVYNHLRDKVKDFLRPFAESGQAVGAEDIKKYFEGLRGDSEAIQKAGQEATSKNDDGPSGGGNEGGDTRKDQPGY
jgi:E3 ubiquitin-protein ligase UBR7